MNHVHARHDDEIDDGGVRIAYTADWHVLEVKGGSPVDQAPRLEAVIDRLNALAPDLVVHGGDLITRYDVEHRPLDDESIRRQYRQVDALLAALDVPIAVFPGNHDVAFPVCKDEWTRRFGEPGNGDTWDRSVVLGPLHLLLMDGFATYDPRSGAPERNSLTSNQLAWLEREASTRQAEHRVLALHYDYENQVLPRLDELGIDCFLYGHSSAHDQDYFDGADSLNGHLPGSAAYRLLTATADAIGIGPPVSYASLTTTQV